MELHDKYVAKVEAADNEIDDEIRTLEGTEAELGEDEIYMKRLDAGLFTLQLVDFIILDISCCGASTVKSRVMQTLNMKGGSSKVIFRNTKSIFPCTYLLLLSPLALFQSG